jgi:hypothetical protein
LCSVGRLVHSSLNKLRDVQSGGAVRRCACCDNAPQVQIDSNVSFFREEVGLLSSTMARDRLFVTADSHKCEDLPAAA